MTASLRLAVAPHHWLAIAIGIVQPLWRGLTARAERASIDRVVGIALHLEHATVARLDQDAAAGRTLATRTREIRGDAGDGVVRRSHVQKRDS